MHVLRNDFSLSDQPEVCRFHGLQLHFTVYQAYSLLIGNHPTIAAVHLEKHGVRVNIKIFVVVYQQWTQHQRIKPQKKNYSSLTKAVSCVRNGVKVVVKAIWVLPLHLRSGFILELSTPTVKKYKSV